MIEFLGIIPARAGSKGLPHKNIKEIAGKPLIAWTIERALQSRLVNKLVISTDDKVVMRVANDYGVDVIDRPKEIASDKSHIIHTICHALDKYPAKAIVLLQPTSPIRSRHLIDYCITTHIYSSSDVTVTGFTCNYKPYDKYGGRRQGLETYFRNDGNVFVINKSLIDEGKTVSSNYTPVIVSREENIDIDDEFDFWIAEKILSERKI